MTDHDARSGSGASPGRTVRDVDTDTRWARRSPGGAWWLGLLAIPLILAALSGVVKHGAIEDDLTARTAAALEGAGITGADIDFSGRDGTITLPAGADASEATSIAEDVDGVRVVEVSGSDAGGGDDTSGDLPDFAFVRKGDTVTVKATVPDQSAKDALLAAAPGLKVVDQVTIEEGASAPEGLAALLGAVATQADASATLTDGVLDLRGTVPDEATRTRIRELALGLGVEDVNDGLVVAAAENEGCADLQSSLDALLKVERITFAESSAVISSSSKSTVESIANLTKACADARIEVGGHTDNQGSTSTSQPLSEARAKAVRALLIDSGLTSGQVTAKGYGESEPIASNSTDAGRAENRRISIKVL